MVGSVLHLATKRFQNRFENGASHLPCFDPLVRNDLSALREILTANGKSEADRVEVGECSAKKIECSLMR